MEDTAASAHGLNDGDIISWQVPRFDLWSRILRFIRYADRSETRLLQVTGVEAYSFSARDLDFRNA